MSESDRTPGNRNRSQVPPLEPRASRMAYVVPGASVCRWQAAPIPDRPAPTIITSTCSGVAVSPERAELVLTVLPAAVCAVVVPAKDHTGAQPYATLWADVSCEPGLPRPGPLGDLMTTLVPPLVATDVSDGPAIAELHRLHALQRKAFLADPYPSA